MRILFGRLGRTILCLLAQLLALFSALRLCAGLGGGWFRIAMLLASWAAVVLLVSGSAEGGYKTAWSIVVLALPVFGLLCYALLGGSRKNRRLRLLHRDSADYLHRQLPAGGIALGRLLRESPSAGAQAAAIVHLGGCPIYYGGATSWFSSGEACFCAMLSDLRAAERQIWLEYYIIRPGVMWDTILRILRQKAAQGLDVRVIYDDFGCLSSLPRSYPETLRQMRIQCRVFNPIAPLLTARLGNRDHRKLMLIDGRICYTGGINLSDEYIGLRQRCGHWRDGALRLEGSAVFSFSALFLSMWGALTHEPQTAPPRPPVIPGDYCYVQPFWDSPLHSAPVGRSAIAGLISRAERSIWLMTPYFVPDEALLRALCLAAASGIDVKIMTPGIGDHWYTQALTRAHDARLLAAGVELYEYAPGFLHAKVCCADEQTAIVGTVNLDYRSFYLQFEDGLWLYGRAAVTELAEDFRRTLSLCRRITPEQCKKTPWFRRAGRAVLRLFAPLT